MWKPFESWEKRALNFILGQKSSLSSTLNSNLDFWGHSLTHWLCTVGRPEFELKEITQQQSLNRCQTVEAPQTNTKL